MPWTVKDDGFIVPEGWTGWDKGEESEEYKRAFSQFTRVIKEGKITNTVDAKGGSYGSTSFGDTEIIQFYFKETSLPVISDDHRAKAVQPFYKKHIYPKIEAATKKYIKDKYEPDSITADEQVLIDGFNRYLPKLKDSKNDINLALRKIGDLSLAKINTLFFDGTPPTKGTLEENIINTFFNDQLKVPGGGGDGTIAEAEKLELEKKKQLNLVTGKNDAPAQEGLGAFLDSINPFAGAFSPPERRPTTVNLDNLKEEELAAVRQGVLMSDVLNDKTPSGEESATLKYMKNWHKNPPSGSFPGRRLPYDGRMYPLTTDESSFKPQNIVNNLYMPSKVVDYYKDENVLSPEMYYSLHWMYTKSDGTLDESEIFLSTATDDFRLSGLMKDGIVSDAKARQVKDAQRNGYGYSISKVSIEYNGTHPGTARNSIDAVLEVELDNMKSLSAICSFPDTGAGTASLKIWELFTVPLTRTVETDSVSGGATAGQYSPEYSAIVLKFWHLEGGWDPGEVRDAHIITLTSTKHDIQRSDDGTAKIIISYRGFPEEKLKSNDFDALASAAVIEQRVEREKQYNSRIQSGKCDDKEIERIKNIQNEFRRLEGVHNFKTGGIIRDLFKAGLVYGYTYNRQEVDKKVLGKKFYPDTTNYVTKMEALGNIDIVPEEGKSIWDSISSNITALFGSETPNPATTLSYNNHCIFLGDILYMMLNTVFKEGTVNPHRHAKSLQLRLLVSSFKIFEPFNKLIQPLAIPIDLKYFASWFHELVVSKEATTLSLGEMTKILIERMLNNTIYNSTSQSNNTELRVENFLDTSGEPLRYTNRNGIMCYVPPSGDTIFKQNPLTHVSKYYNYIVVRTGTPVTSTDSSTYLPIYYGNNRKSTNYVTDVAFKKTEIEAVATSRALSRDYGSIVQLANVYDLAFKIKSPKAISNLYPGMQVDFILTDWSPELEYEIGDYLGDSDPHKEGTLADIIGIGGYYNIKKIKYTLKLNVWNDFQIEVVTNRSGSKVKKLKSRIKSSNDTSVGTKKNSAACPSEDFSQALREYAEQNGLQNDLKSKLELNETTPNEGDKEAERIKEDKVKEDIADQIEY